MKSVVVINLNSQIVTNEQKALVAGSLTNSECRMIIEKRKRDKLKARLRRMPLHLRALRAVILPVYIAACFVEKALKSHPKMVSDVSHGFRVAVKTLALVAGGLVLAAVLAYLGFLEHGYSNGGLPLNGLLGNGRIVAALLQSALLISVVLIGKQVLADLKSSILDSFKELRVNSKR